MFLLLILDCFPPLPLSHSRRFLQTLKEHPAEDGWKVLVCSHAPIMGSGLRVLQNVHVTNGCAWLNHCSDTTRGAFLRAVQDHQQVKLWFSGHFHLSHDYQDAISTVGSCTFVQAGVVGPASTRDGRRQTRLVRGCSTMLQIYTINHHLRNDDDGSAVLRLDAEIDLASGTVTMAHGNQDYDHADWFQAYSPAAEDGCVAFAYCCYLSSCSCLIMLVVLTVSTAATSKRPTGPLPTQTPSIPRCVGGTWRTGRSSDCTRVKSSNTTPKHCRRWAS